MSTIAISLEDLGKRKRALAGTKPRCPHCGVWNTKLERWDCTPAAWKCNGCKREFEHEPDPIPEPVAKSKLPPDPEGMNDERADWAEEALAVFMESTGSDSGDAISDLIADLRHLCDRQPERYGTFDHAMCRATTHYTEETDSYE